MTKPKRKQSRHSRYDREYLTVANLLNDIKQPTKVINSRQVIVNKALAMTHKTLTNGKEFRQLQSVIRQVYKLQENIPFVKEAESYMLVVAPKGFLSHINRLIDSCNNYIEQTPLLKLDKQIQKMDYIDNIDLKGVLFYDKHGNHSNYSEDENMIQYIKPQEMITVIRPTEHEIKVMKSNTTHKLGDIL